MHDKNDQCDDGAQDDKRGCFRARNIVGKLGLPPSSTAVDLLYAVFVGLSIIELATSRRNGKVSSKAAFKLAFDAISGEQQ
jgi:hypothetical protein